MSERILDAAETALRRFGVEKTNVVDVARALNMSHGNIYRYFPSKKALIDAVITRWLETVNKPLLEIVHDGSRPAAERLAAWFDTLRTIKRRKLHDDPELFRLHQEVVGASPEMVEQHIAALVAQIERIIADGIIAQDFPLTIDAPIAAKAFLHATMAFHHPALVVQKPAPTEANAQAVLALAIAGLRAGMV